MNDIVRRRFQGRTDLALCLACLFLTSSGCSSGPRHDKPEQAQPADPAQPIPDIKSADVDPTALRADVDSFAFTFESQVSSVASDMAHSTSDRAIRESAIRWKMQVIPAVDSARRAYDPRTALAGVWAICVRQRALFDGEFGQKSFGDQAETAQRLAADLEEQIVEVARRYLSPERADQVSAELERLATEAPTIAGYDIGIGRTRPAPKDKDAQNATDPLSALLELPMMPLQVAGAIGDTPDEIRNFANVAAGFGETARNVPEQLRWQMELLLLETENHPVSKAAESVSQAARALQESIDRPDGPVNTLHEAAHDTLLAAEKADAISARAESIVASIDGHAAALTQTAGAWESTVHSVQDLLDAWEASHPPSANPEGDSAFDLKGATAAAEQTRAAISEARSLLSEFESADFRDKVAQVDAASRGSIDHAAERLDDAIARLTWCLCGVVILSAAAVTASRLVVHHFTRAAG